MTKSISKFEMKALQLGERMLYEHFKKNFPGMFPKKERRWWPAAWRPFPKNDPEFDYVSWQHVSHIEVSSSPLDMSPGTFISITGAAIVAKARIREVEMRMHFTRDFDGTRFCSVRVQVEGAKWYQYYCDLDSYDLGDADLLSLWEPLSGKPAEKTSAAEEKLLTYNPSEPKPKHYN
jgi:hypothetical protein